VTVTALANLVRRAAPFAALPDAGLDAVLDMLRRYPSEDSGAAPEITWDRITGELRGPPGAHGSRDQRGTIPDRGLFTVIPCRRGGHGSRGGELDERWSTSPASADVSCWARRLAGGGHHPRPGDRDARAGQAAPMPFWKGDNRRAAAGTGRRGKVRPGAECAGRAGGTRAVPRPLA